MMRYGLSWLMGICTASAAIELQLPTENHYLYTGENDKFYTYVNRTFEGVVSQPWEGGTYGMVRNPMRLGDVVIQTKFHEGIDITPLQRDSAGNPLDEVRVISPGRVVHVSPVAGRSNYGKYVVVEHDWDGVIVYSLYAHLAEVHCAVGDQVRMGDAIAKLGYTGAGLDRVRAHLHLEVGMILSSHYDAWNQAAKGGENYHGLYNGMNLIGLNAAELFLKHRANPNYGFRDWVEQTPMHFQVAVPARGVPDFAKRYPWMLKGEVEHAKSWVIGFSAMGVPLSFEASDKEVSTASVVFAKESSIPQCYATRRLLTGSADHLQLSSTGRQLLTLLLEDFPMPPEQASKDKVSKPKG